MAIHKLHDIIGRDVHHIDFEPETDTCLRYRIVRHPADPTGYYPAQTQTIVDYRGDDAQHLYSLWSDAYESDKPTIDAHPYDCEDDEQNPEASV